MESSDPKILFAALGIILTIIGFVPYIKSILKREARPHVYTWLIWAITQGTALAALLIGGGKLGALGIFSGLFFVIIVLLLSFKYGTKGITKGDTITLIAAFAAIVLWWQLDSPLVAVLLVSAIDALGYIPTLRKTYSDPSSESATFWGILTLALVFTILSNAEYNFLTMTYVSVLFVGNIVVATLVLWRRRTLKIETTS